MPFEAWSIGILVRGTTNADRMFAGISSQARLASINAELATGKINAAGAAAQRNALRLEAANQRMGQMAGFAAGAVALMSGAFIYEGVRSAGELQRAMIAVQNATGATGASLQALQSLVISTSGATAQSANTIAEEMAMAARSGLNNVSQLTQLFPLMARFADVQFLSPQHEDPVEAIRSAVQIAHYLKAYTPATLAPILELVNKTMQMQPEDLGKIVRQGKYFMPLASDLGMSPKDIFTVTAMMGQTGFLLGRGGTSIENFLAGMLKGPNIITAHMQKKQSDALIDLGLMSKSGHMNFFGGGKFHAIDALRQLQSREKQFGEGGAIRVAGDLLAAFGKQASQFLLTISDPIVAARMKQIEAQFNKLPSIQQMFDRYIGSFMGGWQQMTTNFRNIAIEIFLPILPYLTTGMKSVSAVLMQLSHFLDTHPKAGLGIAIGAFATMVVAAAYAVKQLWNLNLAIGAMGDLARANAGVVGASAAANAAGAGESTLSKAGRWGGIAWLGSMFAGALKWAFGNVEHRGEAGAGMWLATRGVLGTAVNWGAIGGFLLKVIPWALRVGNWVGWIIAGLSLLNKLPDIAVFIHNWWERSYPGIMKNLGYAFGMLSSGISDTFSRLLTAAGSAIGSITTLRAIAALVSGNTGAAAALWSQAWSNALAGQGGWTNAPPGSPTDYLRQGLKHQQFDRIRNIINSQDAGHHAKFLHGMRGPSEMLSMNHTGTIDVRITGATRADKALAKAVAFELSKTTRSDLRTSSSTVSLPNMSRMEVAPA